jgi:acetate kinase
MANGPCMKPADPLILTINGGSSSIKFALFEATGSLQRILEGGIERIDLPNALLKVKGLNREDNFTRTVTAPDHAAAVGALMDWIEERFGQDALSAVGHRIVHGGPTYTEPQRITPEMVEALRGLSPFDPEHLPEEILLTEAFQRRFPDLAQVACFDTAFYHNLPRIAQLLPIPRRYEAQGVRRYGFHGLSYEFLVGELARLAGPVAARGRVILAHLGNGASLAAVRESTPVDTSMAFTPNSGVPMGARSGDLDPGLFWYLARTEGLDAKQFNEMVHFHSGLLGVSETSSDNATCSSMNRRTCGPLKPSRCSATKSRNASARSRRRWADWTRSYSQAVSARTRLLFAPGFARDLASLESS